MAKSKANALSNPRRPVIWNQILLAPTFSALGFVLAIALAAIGEKLSPGSSEQTKTLEFLQGIGSFLAFVVFIFITYSNSWNFGFRDINVVKMGYEPEDMKRGLKASLFTQIPVLLTLLALFIAERFGATSIALPIYNLYNYIFYWLFLLMGKHPYLGFLYAIFPIGAFCGGFYCGKKNISLAFKAMYKKKTNGKKPDPRYR
jgi:hypothetical protein